MKQPSLRPEDGTEFFGRVDLVEDPFRASCHARDNHQIEAQEFKMCRSEEEALEWIAQIAGERGFSTWWQLTCK